jgi:carboxymethylenebutenolidase
VRHLILLAACLQLVACGGDNAPEAVTANPEQPVGAAPDPAPAAPDPAASAEARSPAAASDSPSAGLLEQELAYGATEDRNLVGFFALPGDVIEPLPGVILIHDGQGLRDTVEDVARQLAEQGYAVLAVDLYGGTVPTTPAEVERATRDMLRDPEAVLANLRQAYDYLDQYALAPRIAMLGWQLGGHWALEAALAMGGELDGAVIYYGDVATDESRLGNLSVPVLGIFAEDDASVSLRQAQTFRNVLRDLGKRADVYIYSKVGSGFADPTAARYDAAAAAEAWQATLAFLETELKAAD